VAALIENMKKHKLIVGHDFSISNVTDKDSQTDYFPGIWAISSQKEALRFARKILAEGDHITVTDYDDPKYHRVANKFIRALGLKQELFPEAKQSEQTCVTNGKPSNLAQFKKYLTTGRNVKILYYDSMGVLHKTFDASVIRTQNKHVIVESKGHEWWMECEKASEWAFDDNGANQFINRNGEYKLSTRIEYKD